MGNLQSTTVKNKLKIIKQRSQKQPSGKTQHPLTSDQKGSCEWDGENNKLNYFNSSVSGIGYPGLFLKLYMSGGCG